MISLFVTFAGVIRSFSAPALYKLGAVALQKRSFADPRAFMRRDHAQVLVGFKERDMGKIGGQDHQGLTRDDTLLLVMPLPHLLASHIGILLDLFHGFCHAAFLLR